MAKKQTAAGRRRAAPPRDRDDDEFLDDRDDGAESPAEMDLAEFMEGVGASASFIAVYRSGKPGENDAFLENVSAPGFTEQNIRENYGPGKYRLKFKAPDARGRNVYLAQKTVVIGELRPVAGGNGGGHQVGSIEYIREENKRQFDLLIALIARPQPAQPAMDLAGIAALLTAVNGGGRGQSLTDVIAAVTQLKAAAEPKDPIAGLSATIDMVQKLRGDGTKEESWSTIVKDVLSYVVPGGPTGGRAMLPAAGAGRVSPGVPGVSPGVPGGPAGGVTHDMQPEEYEPQEPQEMTTQQWLFAQVNFIKQKAQLGKPPADWVHYVATNQEEPGNAAIIQAFRGGATFDHLCAYFPDIAANPPLRVWFQAFYDGLSNVLRGNTGGAAGNLGNSVVDATASAPGQEQPENPPAGGFAWESPRT